MQTKELILTALHQSYGMVLPLLEDLKSDSLALPTHNGGNHAYWILGHLVHSEGHFRWMMRGIDNPVAQLSPIFATGTIPDPQGKDYPPYEELLITLVSMRKETMHWIETLAEEDLDQTSKCVPQGFEPFFGTWRQCLLMQTLHWMNHRGQLADCRRSVNRGPMMA